MLGYPEILRQRAAKQQIADNLDDVGELLDMVARWEAELAEYCKHVMSDAAGDLSDALGNAKGALMKVEADLLEGE